MKINEVVTEGVIGSIAKGVSDIVAPGAYDKSRRDLAVISASKGSDVEYQGLKYRWLGNQWGVVNPDTDKVSPAGKDMQARLNFWAQRNPAKQKQQQSTTTVGQYGPPKTNKVIDLNGHDYQWADGQWTIDNGKTITNPADIQTLNKAAYDADKKEAKAASTTSTANIPQGEAQSPVDLVDRIFKLHPDWAPEVAKQILNRSQVSGNK